MTAQWEKNLRRQLSNLNSVGTEKTESPLNNQYINIPSPKKESGLNIYVVCLIMLGFLMAFAYNYKTGAISNILESFKSSEEVNEYEQMQIEIQNIQDSFLNANEENEKLNSNLKFNNERITLIGLLLNENFIINKKNYDKNDLLFLNKNWKLNKMPKYVKLTPEDKEFLSKFVGQ